MTLHRDLDPSAAAAAAAAAADNFPWLVADIGGTHARFALVTDASLQPREVQQLRGVDHAGAAQAAQAYLDARRAAAQARGEHFAAPRQAAFAVATALDGGDRVELTNSPWSFSRAQAAAALGLDALLVVNDFEALALALPTLTAAQLRCHGAMPQARGALGVVGPGTGLGVGGVIETAHGWRAIPGEGGHATLAAADDFESELLTLVRREHGHVSAERLLSGLGLPLLHRAVMQIDGGTRPDATPDTTSAVSGNATGAAPAGAPTTALTAAQISEHAMAGTDAACVRTVDVFCALLGGFAGNLALTLGARGGLYIGGGIVPRWGDRFFASRFRERFEAKGRFRRYLEGVPTALIVDTQAALGGAATAIRQHLVDRAA